MTKPNPEQLKVINHESGPLLVVAGAGTGKTKTIIGHVNRLLDQEIPSRSILALTFTEKAAQEMLNRLLDSRKVYDLDIPISTFNAFGEKILREFAADIGLSRSFTLLQDNSQVVFMRERLDQFDLDYFDTAGSPDYQLKEIAEHISTAKQNLITPERYVKFAAGMPDTDEAEVAEKSKYQELARHYETYQRLCRENNVIDYDDQVYLLVELLKSRPNVRKILRDRYHTILVDEFQDTNTMQSELIDLLVGEQKNLIVVGDDDQSIYGFRGATLRNILEFTTRHPQAEVVTLLTNYRSSQSILDRAYALITNNNPDRLEEKLGINKKLIADSGSGPDPVCRRFSKLSDELGWVAHDIKSRLDSGEDAGEIAVLTRGNARAEQVSEALSALDIEHDLVGGSYDLYSEPAVAMILETLTAISRTDDNRSLYNSLVSEIFNVDIGALASLLSDSYRSHESLSELIENSKTDKLESARQALAQIEKWRIEAPKLRITQVAYKIIRESGYIERLDSYGRNSAAAEAESVQTFGRIYQLFRKLKEFEKVAILPSLQAFIDDLPTIKAAAESLSDDTLDLSSRRVSVLTAHKAKGLEWQTVYIVGAVQGSFPYFGGSSGIPLPAGLAVEEAADKRVNEERRLMYVAATRAKQNLLISYADNKSGEHRPSQFLMEMFGREQVLGIAAEPENTELRLDIVGDGQKIPDEVAIPESIKTRDDTILLSPSAIETFNRCPYDYYWRFIRHVPDEPRTTLDVGTLLHTEFEKFNRGKQQGQLPPLSELLQSLEVNFPKIGFFSKADRNKRLNQALDALADFYERHKNDGEKILAVEEEFRIRFNEEKIVIRGRYDAVFEVDGKIVIRDYKSGRTNKTAEKAKQKANASEQLTMYAMAWQDSTGDLPARLELEFVETHQVGAVARKQASIETMRGKIVKMAECIRQRNFPMGEQHQYCKHPH